MLLPNKLFSYEETVLPLLSVILRALDKPKTPKELCLYLKVKQTEVIRIIDALDCLFALGKIELNEDGGIFKC